MVCSGRHTDGKIYEGGCSEDQTRFLIYLMRQQIETEGEGLPKTLAGLYSSVKCCTYMTRRALSVALRAHSIFCKGRFIVLRKVLYVDTESLLETLSVAYVRIQCFKQSVDASETARAVMGPLTK